MVVSNKSHLLIENKILAALSEAEYQRLVPHLEQVHLPVKQVLYEAGEPITHVYFPNQAVASLVCIQEDGSTVEAGMVSNDGMVGLPVIWGGNSTTTCECYSIIKNEYARLLRT